jgi:hypothetical protein
LYPHRGKGKALGFDIAWFISKNGRAGMTTAKKSIAGKRSGIKRAKVATLRRFYVLSAFEQLRAEYRIQPYSDASIDALEEEFRRSPERSPDLDRPLERYESVVRRNRRAPSDKLTSLLDDAVAILVEYGPGHPSLYNASRHTLIKDLKALGIKSKSRRNRSG